MFVVNSRQASCLNRARAVLSPVIGIATSAINLYFRYVQKTVDLETLEKKNQQ
jgi:hypothetical protein